MVSMHRGHTMTRDFRDMALGEYMHARKVFSDAGDSAKSAHFSLVMLCLASTMAEIGEQSRVRSKTEQRLKALGALAMYERERFESTDTIDSVELRMEISYNIGRFMEFMEKWNLAVGHYRRVLSLARERSGVSIEREAAFNLSRIYERAGRPEAARSVLRDYLTL